MSPHSEILYHRSVYSFQPCHHTQESCITVQFTHSSHVTILRNLVSPVILLVPAMSPYSGILYHQSFYWFQPCHHTQESCITGHFTGSSHVTILRNLVSPVILLAPAMSPYSGILYHRSFYWFQPCYHTQGSCITDYFTDSRLGTISSILKRSMCMKPPAQYMTPP
ncbi:hypothetical protein PoB_006439000 [Plakobranchus ocellatus]|uniref:Uncharacterized protein n=1 Tax=Plakobranchus ocellatus TaxID=259542 RepID=A0AAV4D199_9GAST|nr:hypothetical protein PoB_006439000 [Plakobranchus ocellatus]